MRDLADADALAAAIAPGARALIVGGGYIGLEAAAVLREKGLDVTLIEAAPRILARVAAPATADYFRDLHRGHGVELREGDGARPADRRRRPGHRRRARRRQPARRRPRARRHRHRRPTPRSPRRPGSRSTTASASTPQGRTSDPAIFAAGDCAQLPLARRPGAARERAERHRPGRGGGRGDARRRRRLSARGRGSGRTSTTSSCRSPGSTPAGTAR